MDVQQTASAGGSRPHVAAGADSAHLMDYADLIWRYKLIVVGAAIVAAGAAAWWSSLAPRGYESTVTFAAVQSKLGDNGQMAPNPAAFRPMVESLTTAAAVIRENGLDKPPYGWRPSDFLDSIAVAEVRGTSLLTVKVTMGDPALSATIANSVAEHAVQTARRVSATEVTYARDLIKKELDDAGDRLQLAEARLREYRQEARIEAVRKDVEARLGGPLSPTVSLSRTAATATFVDNTSGGRGGLLDIAVKLASEKARLTALERDLSARTAARTDPAYQSLDAAAATARSNVASLEQQKAELTSAHRPDAATMAALNQLYVAEGELARRQVERDVAERTFVELSQKFQDARLQVIGKSAEFVIVDPAVPADRPVSRHVARNAVLVLAVWLCFASAGVIVWDSAQKRRATR